MAAHVGKAPASSANLGPGFDSFALAIGGHAIEVRVEPNPDAGCLVTGHDEVSRRFPTDEGNVAAQTLIAITGERDWRVDVTSQLPAGGGMGSSAALITATVGAAWESRRDNLPDLLTVTSQLEHLMGNPSLYGDGDPNWLSNVFLEGKAKGNVQADNPAAAYAGGLVIAINNAAGRLQATPCDLDPAAELVIVVPDMQILTADARRFMPQIVTMESAVSEIRSAALLIMGLRDFSKFPEQAAITSMHQQFRLPLFPQSPQIFAAMREAGAVHACMSGSGPTMLAICDKSSSTEVQGAALDAMKELGVPLRFTEVLQPDYLGLQVDGKPFRDPATQLVPPTEPLHASR